MWEEGPPLSTGRSNIATVIASPHLVCLDVDPEAYTCPADGGTGKTCIFSNMEQGTQIKKWPK